MNQKPVVLNSTQASASAPRATTHTGRALSLLALTLSLFALGGAGWLFIEGKNNQQRNQEQLERLQALTDGVRNDQTQNLQAALGSQNFLLEHSKQVDDTLRTLETSVKVFSLDQNHRIAQDTESLLNTVSIQLQMGAGNEQAIEILTSLSKRLAQHNALINVRQAVENDLAKLKNNQSVDKTSISLRLNHLLSDVDNLSLMTDSLVNQVQPNSTIEKSTNNQGLWYQHWWKNIQNMTKNWVQVRPLKNADAMMISPEQVYFLRHNIRLYLLDARLALLGQEAEIYRSDLDNVITEVSRHFDGSTPSVTQWINEATLLRDLFIQSPTGEPLAESLAAVRQYLQSTEVISTSAEPKTDEKGAQ